MADVFLSYSSKDRAAAERVQAALTARGIDVFWDQETPAGQDWDTWIRNKLSICKVAIVLWSRESVKSDNVRHEALVARKANKLIPAIIDPVAPEDLPMGLYMVQTINLADWRSADSRGLVKLADEIDARLGRPSRQGAAAATKPDTGDSKARATTTLVLVGIAAVVAAVAWFMIQKPPESLPDCSSGTMGDGCSVVANRTETVRSPAVAQCLDGSTPVNDMCANGNRPIPPAPVLGSGGGSRASAGSETFASKIVGHWNWDGVACANGPNVTLEGGQLVFTTPESRFVHAIESGGSQDISTIRLPKRRCRPEISSDAGVFRDIELAKLQLGCRESRRRHARCVDALRTLMRVT